MNEHIGMIVDEYKDNLNVYKTAKNVLYKKLDYLLTKKYKIKLAGLESRVKSINSLKEKISIKGMKYKSIDDITDILGFRIITFYNDEVDKISAIIEKTFDIDYENSIDKRKILEVDRFGYMSLHYICKVPKTLYSDPKLPKLNEIKFEIQIRTALQHVWAAIFHDTGYKTDIEVPREYIRDLSRLSGVLELADKEFKSIRDDINNYRNNIKKLVSNGKFKDITFNIDSYTNYLMLNPFDELIGNIAKTNNCEIEEISLIPYYDVLVKIGIKYLAELEDIRIKYSKDAFKLSLVQLQDKDIDILLSSVGIRNLILLYIVNSGGSETDIVDIYDMLYGRRKSNKTIAHKMYEQCKSVLSI